jgi:hypothetical protein
MGWSGRAPARQRWKPANSLRALVHRQFSVGSNIIKAQYIDVAVAGPDLEITIACAVLLIDVFANLDRPGIEAKSAEFLNAVFIDIDFDLYLHDLSTPLVMMLSAQEKTVASGIRPLIQFVERCLAIEPALLTLLSTAPGSAFRAALCRS